MTFIFVLDAGSIGKLPAVLLKIFVPSIDNDRKARFNGSLKTFVVGGES